MLTKFLLGEKEIHKLLLLNIIITMFIFIENFIIFHNIMKHTPNTDMNNVKIVVIAIVDLFVATKCPKREY